MQLCPNLWLLRLHPQVLEPHGIHGPTLKSMAPDATALYIHQRALLWKRFVIAGLWTKAPPASHLGQKRAEVTTSPNLTTRHFRDIMIPWCPFMNHHLKALRVDVAMIHSLIKNEYNDIICISAAFWNESNEHHSANLPLHTRLAQQRNVRVKVGVAQVAHSKHQVAGQRYRVTSSLATAPHASQLRRPGSRKIEISRQPTWKSLQKL